MVIFHRAIGALVQQARSCNGAIDARAAATQALVSTAPWPSAGICRGAPTPLVRLRRAHRATNSQRRGCPRVRRRWPTR